MRKFVGLMLMLMVVVGCSDGVKFSEIDGKVTLKNKPLAKVRLNFVCSDNNIVSTDTDASGMYTIPRIPVGEVKLSVTPSVVVPTNPQMQGKGGTAEQKATKMEKVEATVVPAQYANADTAKLTYTIKDTSKQTINIELK